MDPTNRAAYGNAGLCYRLLKKPDSALIYLNRYLDLKPNHLWTIKQLSYTYSDLNDYKSAYSFATKATELEAENYSNWFSLSFYALFVGKPQEAIQAAKKTLELNPEAVSVETNLALGYVLNNQYAEAEKIYLKWKGKNFPNDKRLCDEIFLADIAALEQAGITHPDFEKVKKLLGK
jgi:tetratricopeptide (TPR) repeat protein